MYIKNFNCSENSVLFFFESLVNLFFYMGDLFRDCFFLFGVIEDIRNVRVIGLI